jgi:hypothetical protein
MAKLLLPLLFLIIWRVAAQNGALTYDSVQSQIDSFRQSRNAFKAVAPMSFGCSLAVSTSLSQLTPNSHPTVRIPQLRPPRPSLISEQHHLPIRRIAILVCPTSVRHTNMSFLTDFCIRSIISGLDSSSHAVPICSQERRSCGFFWGVEY